MPGRLHALTISAATLLWTTQPAAETLVYAVLMNDLQDPYWNAMQLGLKEGTEEAEAEYYLQATEANQTAEQQLDICNTMIDRRPNMLIASPIDTDKIAPCFERAEKLDIPIVNLNSSDDGNYPAVAINIATDNSNAGSLAAEYLSTQLDNTSEQTALLLESSGNDPIASQRERAFKQTLKKLAPAVNVVSLSSDNTIEQASQHIEQNPNLKAIFSTNGTLALKTADTVFQADKSDDILVVSVDSSIDTIDSVTSGKLHAAVVRHPFLTGKQLIAEADKLLNGNKVNEINTRYILLTKKLLDNGIDSLIRAE